MQEDDDTRAERVCNEFFAQCGQMLAEENAHLLFIHRYGELQGDVANCGISLTVLRDEDMHGTDRGYVFGIVDDLTCRRINSRLKGVCRRVFEWTQLDADLQKHITNCRLPFEWHNKMDDPAYQARAWLCSNSDAPRPPLEPEWVTDAKAAWKAKSDEEKATVSEATLT